MKRESHAARPAGADGGDTAGMLERGRAAHARRAWADAFGCLSAAEAAMPLGAADLERLAEAAYLSGRDDDYLGALGRAHQAHAAAGETARAIRCAFWIGLELAFRGETGPAGGWFGRARRLLQHQNGPSVEEGYLLLPQVEQHLQAGETERAATAAERAAAIGERFGDVDLGACARHLQGKALIRGRRIEAGLALLDEAMAAVSAGALSPILTGLIYCSVIDACRQVYALDRARAWTAALAGWCAGQAQLVAFTTACQVHRAEIMRRGGAWDDAIAEADRVCAPAADGTGLRPAGQAYYERAEIHRMRGGFALAEDDYRRANQCGFEPQPGLSLLRLAQGRAAEAGASMRRLLEAAGEPLRRSRLLPAAVEIGLALGEVAAARGAADELQEIATAIGMPVLGAMAAQAAAAVALAEGDAPTALAGAERALAVWLQVEAPYEAARVRVLLGRACRALGDADGAAMELDAACDALRRLGAAPDLAAAEALLRDDRVPAHGLTRREVEIVRLVATGKTNREIADQLCVSVRTVDRHLENVFGKLDLGSRAAATAYAYRHHLV